MGVLRNLACSGMGGYLVKQPIYVLGHRNPDTDSICSAIAYAFMKKALGEEVIAARAGKINAETKYVLEYFNIAAPMLISDLHPRVHDAMIEDAAVVHPWQTLRELGEIIKETGSKSVPVVDEDKTLRGIVTVGDLAKRYFEELEMADLSSSGVTFAGMLRALDGVIEVSGDLQRNIVGAVRIAAAQSSTIVELVKANDIVLIGDREDAQLVCLKMGISCLIVTSNTLVSAEVKQEAARQGAIVIRAPYDTYTCARLINQSIPVRDIMQTKVLAFKGDDMLADIKPVILSTNHRAYPVVQNEKLQGLIRRDELIAPQRDQVILVDHNERTQAVDGIESADILEIIDHHRLGGMETGEPIFIRHEPVGSTATIIANMCWHRGVEVPKVIAGLLLSAILSDTILFKSPTCTAKDRGTAERLAVIADVDIQSYGTEMLKAGASTAKLAASDLLHADLKEFQMAEFRIVIGQISVLEVQDVLCRKGELLEEMEAMRNRENYDMVLLLVTDILQEASHLIFAGEPEELLEQAFSVEIIDHEVYLPGVLSRKKQVVPPMVNTAKSWSR